MKSFIKGALCLSVLLTNSAFAQSIPVANEQYHYYGPNSWGEYLQVGGSGRVTNSASVAVTNGNLHLDSKSGSYGIYLNYYSQNNTLINAQGGNVGIRTVNPQAVLDIGAFINDQKLGTVFGRLEEGNGTGEGTFLGVRGYQTQGTSDIKSFAIEHSFYGEKNSSINFFRGGNAVGGFLAFNTDNNTEKMRIMANGNVGIGTINPTAKLTVAGNIQAREITVSVDAGADYVFKAGYGLKPLPEVEDFINANQHLPEIAPAAKMEKDGMNLSAMNIQLLKKIEELTLYLIEKDKEIKELSQRVLVLEKVKE